MRYPFLFAHGRGARYIRRLQVDAFARRTGNFKCLASTGERDLMRLFIHVDRK